MEIENNHLSILARQAKGAATQREGTPEGAAGQTAGPSRASDSVSLTPAAQLLRDVESRVAAQPVVDSQRVSAMREALADGSFNIDPARIAERMMGMEQALARLH